jgi:tRNA G18 (ribose-2'-O)-methylase SpoU
VDLSLYTGLKDRDLRREGLLVAEGGLLAERLLASGWPVLGVACSPRFADRFAALSRGICPLEVLCDERMAAVAGYGFHRGVLAVGRRPPFPSLEQVLGAVGERSTLAVCPELTNAENLGSVIRSAAAFGLDGVLLGPRCCDPLSRKALKVSMGAAFGLPLVPLDEEAHACGDLHAAGFTVAVTSLCADALPLEGFRRGPRLCLVFGNEAMGVGEPWRSCCDLELTVPMQAGSDSLNAAVSAGIFFYALRG